MTPFAQAAPDLIDLGYSPIPIIAPDAVSYTHLVAICQARRRLKERGHAGPSIVNEWGFGYRLMPDARAFVAARLQPMEMAA